MKDKKENVKASTIANTSKLSYEGKVLVEALERAGGNPNLKGIIHEVMVKDLFNGNPVRLVDGKSAKLVADTTANTVDMVIMQGGKVLNRIQLKDTPKSVVTTIRKAAAGNYRSAQLWGTKETTELFKQSAKSSKDMTSTGISSKTTEALAKRVGRSGSNGVVTVSSSVKTVAKSGAVWGGGVSAVVATVEGVNDYRHNRKNGAEVVKHIAKESAGGAISGAAAGAAVTVVGSALAVVETGLLASTAVTVGAPVVVAIGVGAGVKYLWDKVFD
jgi:hypothetical protein